SKTRLADVVLIAADTFSSMLSAYRDNLQPPAGKELHQHILALTRKPVKKSKPKSRARFRWSEYEKAAISDALGRGDNVYNLAFRVDPVCPMRSAAMQLIRNVLQECGRVLAIAPDQAALSADTDLVEAALSSKHTLDWVEKKCLIPSVISDLVAQSAGTPAKPAEGTLDILQRVTTEEAEPSLLAEEIPASATTEHSAPFMSRMPENLLRVDAERIDNVLNLVGELIIAKSMLHQAVNEFDKRFPKDILKGKFADAMAFQARIMNDLQKSVMKIRMVPVEHL